ncbi:MAG TPA: ABC transporter permease [Flavitalea sp.]|nr:ABC transporter permease [Flavitalea sp.]
MFRNYLKIAIRNLMRYKFFSFINIFGLATGIACCTVILLFVADELSFDKHHHDSERIHRVVKDFVNEDGSRLPDATTPPAIATYMMKEIPEIEHVVRLFPSWGRKFFVKYGSKRNIEENLYRADSSIFNVFTLPFIAGTSKTAFSQLKAIVLTESTAKKYFGTENPIGKTLEVDQMGPHLVTAVIKDFPRTSHFKFDMLVSTRTINGDIDNDWDFYNFYTYFKLKPNTSIATVDTKIKALFKKHQPQSTNYFYTQPLTSIHLNSNLKWELQPNSDKSYLYIVITIGIFIIIIACINYVNLATARSSLRAKEIGVRKVSGAEKGSLVKQFLLESIVVTVLATGVAIILTQLLLPFVNRITGKELLLFSQQNTWLVVVLFISAFLIGMIAGIYPAMYLSSFEPVKVLKGLKLNSNQGFSLRKVLVVSQFTISIALIIGAILISRQVDYIQTAKLGFSKEQVLVINDIQVLERSQRTGFKNELLQMPGVKNVAASDGIVGGQNWAFTLTAKGTRNSQLVNFINVDKDYLQTMNMTLLEGRTFDLPGDTLDALILNETAVKQLGIPKPVIGQQVALGSNLDSPSYGKVIGLVKDFHFTSLRSDIKPFALVTDNTRQGFFNVKIDPKNVRNTIAGIESAWKKLGTERPFQYYFLDETFSKLYQSERNFQSVFFYITILVIIIACLGLFGLVSFMTEQRRKEIGIRKVLGASVTGILALLSKDFLKLVALAALLAFPIAWYAMSRWLRDFAYRTDLSWWIFITAAVVALVIAVLTISLQAFRTAVSNPVKSLRNE